MQNLYQMYIEQLYSESPDLETLHLLARLIEKTLHAEFKENISAINLKIVESLVEKMRKSLNENWTLKKASKLSNLDEISLNKYFFKLYAKTFSKKLLQERMLTAMKCINEGKTLAKTAKLVGYSDGRSLSLAFKKFFGESPSSLKSQCGFK